MAAPEQIRVVRTGPRVAATLVVVGVAILVILPPLQSGDFQQGSPVTIPYLTAVFLLLTWVLARAFRFVLVADTNGLRVRNWFRTYNLWWEDSADLCDGRIINYFGDNAWAVRVRTRKGRAIDVNATAKGHSIQILTFRLSLRWPPVRMFRST
jgi:hypothetical protein